MSVLSFDVNKKIIRTLNCKGDIPNSRDGHTANLVRDKIYVIGGKDSLNNICTDIYTLSLPDLTWKVFKIYFIRNLYYLQHHYLFFIIHVILLVII